MKYTKEQAELKCTCKEHDPYCCQVHGICPTCVKKEEPKQENCCTPIGQIKRYVDCKGCDRKPKQETTLEEAAEKLFIEQKLNTYTPYNFKDAFTEGAKWQRDNSNVELLQFEISTLKSIIQDMDATIKSKYSEEDIREAYEFAIENVQLGRNGYEWVMFSEWFEQFKNK